MAVVLVTLGFTRLSTQPGGDAEPGIDAVEEPAAERWLVDRLSRVRGLRHLVGLFDRYVWGGAIVGIGLAVLLASAALVGWILSTVDSERGFARFDESAAEWGADHATEFSTNALRSITHLGGSATLIALMAIVGLVVAHRHRRHDHPRWSVLGFLATVGVGIVIVNNSLKWLVDRDRPTVEHLASAGGSSFPSGHTAAAAACWAAIALVSARRLPVGRRHWVAAAAVAVAVAVAASRVLLGVHWLTDVIAGLVVGWTWFFVAALAFGGRLQRFGHPAEDVLGQDPATVTAPRPAEPEPAERRHAGRSHVRATRHTTARTAARAEIRTDDHRRIHGHEQVNDA
jgi:undecaprenyl-diphosphatase